VHKPHPASRAAQGHRWRGVMRPPPKTVLPGREKTCGKPTSGRAHQRAGGPRVEAMTRPTKITFGEMRDMGVRGVSADYRCSHSVTMNAERWPDDLRLSDVEGQFTCTACGKRGADLRPDWGARRRNALTPCRETHGRKPKIRAARWVSAGLAGCPL
jgi:hypothetical protein